MLKLLTPHMVPASEIDAFVKEFKDSGATAIPGGAGVINMTGREFLRKRPWLKYENNFCFFTMNEIDEIVGCIRLSTTINEESIRTGAYNIEYSIRPSYRNRGYGTEQLSLGLKWLQSFCSGSIVHLAVKCDNVASNRTARAAGGTEITTREDGLTVWEFRLREV